MIKLLIDSGAIITSAIILKSLNYDTKMEIFEILLEKSSEKLKFEHIEKYLIKNCNEQLIKIIINSNNYDFKSKNSKGNTLLHDVVNSQFDYLLTSLIKVSDVN